jgi:hypothetical protein
MYRCILRRLLLHSVLYQQMQTPMLALFFFSFVFLLYLCCSSIIFDFHSPNQGCQIQAHRVAQMHRPRNR